MFRLRRSLEPSRARVAKSAAMKVAIVRNIIPVFALGALMLLAFHEANARPHEPRGSADRIRCWVTILPQAFFVERIGGDYVDVRVMVGPGQTPHTYEPKSRQLAELAQSDVYFSIGVAFEESALPRIESNFKKLRIVDSCAGIPRRAMTGWHGHEPSPQREAGQLSRPLSSSKKPPGRGSLDPHVWLSPKHAIVICANIRVALAELDPAHDDYFASRAEELVDEIERVDAEIARMLAPYRGREIFVYHPAYGYFTDAYGLTQVEIEERGSIPGPKHLAKLVERAKAARARVIFVQPQVSDTYARTVADAIGARVVPLDPLAMDYTENLLLMARGMVDAFREE
jgi:zinc transport system substrate-binding protein